MRQGLIEFIEFLIKISGWILPEYLQYCWTINGVNMLHIWCHVLIKLFDSESEFIFCAALIWSMYFEYERVFTWFFLSNKKFFFIFWLKLIHLFFVYFYIYIKSNPFEDAIWRDFKLLLERILVFTVKFQWRQINIFLHCINHYLCQNIKLKIVIEINLKMKVYFLKWLLC